MKRVKIYIGTSAKSPKTQCARGIYVLATETGRGVADLTQEEVLEEVTANQAELQILAAALGRLREPCGLVIYTDSAYLNAGLMDWLPAWKRADWRKADGRRIRNAEEWQELDRLLEGCEVETKLGEWHPYRKWMDAELRRKQDV
ncbi:MAG: hypothetical protein NC389_17170 [Acetatifactor muris]|nr:hypothetical protein [Acetatifactor muris]